MRLIIQRVSRGSVATKKDGKMVGQIDNGLFVLVGIKRGDSNKEADYLAEKLVKLRVMSDKNDLMNLSVKDTQSKILVVSQFTLYANVNQGNRPSFIDAEVPQKALEVYSYFIDKLKTLGVGVAEGSFGEYMQIDLRLDGPVTIIYEKDSKNSN